MRLYRNILLATPVETAHDFADKLNADYGRDPFGKLTGYVAEYGSSFYRLVFTIGTFAFLVSIMLAALKLVKKNPAERDEGKNRIGAALIASIIFFGLVSIASFIELVTERAVGAIG